MRPPIKNLKNQGGRNEGEPIIENLISLCTILYILMKLVGFLWSACRLKIASVILQEVLEQPKSLHLQMQSQPKQTIAKISATSWHVNQIKIKGA